MAVFIVADGGGSRSVIDTEGRSQPVSAACAPAFNDRGFVSAAPTRNNAPAADFAGRVPFTRDCLANRA